LLNHLDTKGGKKRLIYLDVCAISRPFDDQSFLRIRLETAAVNLILSRVRQGTYGLVVSTVHISEIEAIEEPVERIELQMLLAALGESVPVDRVKTREKAEELVRLGFGIADAAHVAFAEQSGASFISSDDRLLKRCARAVKTIWSGNPVAFCEREALR
jgi:predicted nucleic acid-binding protein